MDKETGNALRDAEELKQMCTGKGWHIARHKILEKILDLSSVLNTVESDPVKLMTIIAAKQEAVKILTEWLNEVEGLARNADDMRKLFIEEQKDFYIKNFDDSE